MRQIEIADIASPKPPQLAGDNLQQSRCGHNGQKVLAGWNGCSRCKPLRMSRLFFPNWKNLRRNGIAGEPVAKVARKVKPEGSTAKSQAWRGEALEIPTRSIRDSRRLPFRFPEDEVDSLISNPTRDLSLTVAGTGKPARPTREILRSLKPKASHWKGLSAQRPEEYQLTPMSALRGVKNPPTLTRSFAGELGREKIERAVTLVMP